MALKYVPPEFVTTRVSAAEYRRWLDRKAQTHCQRDRGRGNLAVTKSSYKQAIHAAVLRSNGRDAYTDEELDWHLISQYDNELSKAGGRTFKASFARLPTVDHVGDGLGEADFQICGWAINDAKNDLSLEAFVELCRKILRLMPPASRTTMESMSSQESPMPVSIRHDPFPVKDPYHGIYTHGVETRAGARMLHVSGQVGESPEGVLPDDFAGQCRQALLNLEAVLREAGMSFRDIVKMTFFLVRREDMSTLVSVRKEMLEGVRPAVTTLFVSGLVSPAWLVEIEAVACAE